VADTGAPVVGADGDAFDVTGADGAVLVPELPLDHRRVPDQLVVRPDQGVDAAERVVPVGLVEVVEGGVQEGADRRALGWFQVSCMGKSHDHTSNSSSTRSPASSAGSSSGRRPG
jgi:hypothetical protein